jgi:hypothetical protein
MILPGLFPAQVRSRPVVRGAVVYNNARVSSTTMRFNKADIPARAGDMVVFSAYIEGSSFSGDTTSNFNAIAVGTTVLSRVYKLWDGSEPSTLELYALSSTVSIGCYVILVVSGVTKLVSAPFESSTNTSVLEIAQPARFWATVTATSSGSTAVGTPPAGYTGYQQATTTAGDDGGLRIAYRIADENTQLGGSWSGVPTQSSRRSWAFR